MPFLSLPNLLWKHPLNSCLYMLINFPSCNAPLISPKNPPTQISPKKKSPPVSPKKSPLPIIQSETRFFVTMATRSHDLVTRSSTANEGAFNGKPLPPWHSVRSLGGFWEFPWEIHVKILT